MKLKSLSNTLSGIKDALTKLVSKNNETENQYLVIYKTEENKTKSYIITKPDLYESFGNKGEDRDNVGFKAYCYGRDSVRSFRHDRIISITKL
jgi:hypothetical protein